MSEKREFVNSVISIMVMAAGLGMGFEEVKRYCEGSVDLVVQLERRGGVRGVVESERVFCLFAIEQKRLTIAGRRPQILRRGPQPARKDVARVVRPDRCRARH